ncbi:MAG TPA: histidine phosphatase family protein [Bryobacteraceae bacterium]
MRDSLELWLVRHGQTAWSITGQHSGRNDLPLTRCGEIEAESVRPLLRSETFTRVLCSPLQRARRTCEIAGYAGEAVIEPDLQEWDYGDWTGSTQEQVRERIPGWTIWDGPVPSGESIDAVAARARRVIEKLRTAEGCVLLFARGHFLRVLATQWLGLPPQAGRHFALETAAVSVLGEDAGFAVIRRWNLRS